MDSIIEPIIKEMIDGVITMDTGQGDGNDQAQAMERHAAAALAHSMVGMALEVATTPVSVVANNLDCYPMNNNSCEEREAQQPCRMGFGGKSA